VVYFLVSWVAFEKLAIILILFFRSHKRKNDAGGLFAGYHGGDYGDGGDGGGCGGKDGERC
jgi:hypothetical protein